MKKTVSILLVCVMLLGMLPVFAAWTDDAAKFPVIRGESTSEMLVKYGNIMMKPGEPYAYVRGLRKPMPAPYVDGGTVYFPLREIAEFMSTSVEWSPRKNSVTWYLHEYEYIFDIGSSEFKRFELREETTEHFGLGGTVRVSDDSRVFIPLEEVAKAAGLRYSVMDSGIILFGSTEARYELSDFTEEDIKMVEDIFQPGADATRVQKTFYVDPVNGRDSNDGSVEYPLRSLEFAKEEVKNYKKVNGQNGNIMVYLRGGNYTISQTLTFGVEDSGENGYKITYQAYPGESVTIDGGERITGWEKVDDKIYRAYVGSAVSALFEGDHYSTIARHPNEGYHTAIAPVAGPSTTEFKFREGEYPVIESLTGVRWYGWPGGPQGFYNWHFENVPLASIDYETRTIKISKVAYVLGTGSRYYLAGAKEFLDAPGEFWYSPTEKYVYYYPISDNIENATIIRSHPNIFNIKGNSMNELAGNLEFRGFKLRNTSDSMINCQEAANVTIDNCIITNTKSNAVTLPGSRTVAINLTNCDIQNVGGAGYASAPMFQPDDVLSKWHVIKNNKIKNVGLVYPDKEAIELYGDGYSYIGHNHVSDGRNNGIMLKGGSGNNLMLSSTYSSPKLIAAYTKEEFDEEHILFYNPVRYNVVEYNEVDHFMWDSQDGGGIYTHSCGDENIVRNNYIHHVEANFSVCVGLYNDEESRDMKNYNNVVYNNQPYPGLGGDITASNQPWGLSLGGATYNNMFVDNHRDGTLPTVVYYESNDSAWEKNVAVNSGKSINHAKGKHDKWTGVDIGHNLFWNEEDDNYTMASGKYTERDIKMLHNYSWDQHSLFGVDPLYHDKENGDLRFRYTSPAYRLGFRDVDMSDIGLTEEFTIAKGEVPNAMYIRIVDRDTNGYVDLTSGESADLAVVLRDEEGYRVDPDSVTFTTDNSAIATVDATGRITAVSPGVARVNATAVKGDKTFVRPVDVLVEDEIATLNADLSLDPIRIGEHSTVRTWYLTKYGKHVPTGKITYTSADTSVATVDENGFVSGIGEGKTQIIVSDGNLTSAVDIEVRQSMFQSVELAVSVNPVQVGQTSDLKISILNELGVEMEAPDSAVTVTTANEDVLSLEKKSTTEYVLNPIKEGSTNVDVTVKLDGKTVKKTASVFVLNPDDEIDDTWLLANFGVNVDAALTPTRGSFKAYKGGFFEFSSDGYNFWNNQDQGTVAYKKIKLDPANPVAEVKLKFNATSLDDYNKEATGLNMSAFGVIVRTNETAGSPSVHYRWEYGGGKVLYANRDTQDAGCGWDSGDSSESEPELRIIYDNGKVSMYYKANATKGWVLFKSMALKPEGDEIIIGIAGYSQNLDKDGNPLFMTALGNVQINSGAEVDQSDTDYDIGNATLN